MGVQVLFVAFTLLLTFYVIPIYASVSPPSPPAPPKVSADNYITTKNIPIQVSLLVTDDDLNSKQWEFSWSDPDHGIIDSFRNIDLTKASVKYTPDKNYTGPDIFTYTASNGTYETKNAKISIKVNPPNTELILNWTPQDRVNFAFSISFGLIIFILFIAWRIIKHIRKGSRIKIKFWDIIRDENWYPSLAYFQFLLWTVIVMFTYFGLNLARYFSGSVTFLGMPENLVILMGLSAAVPVINNVVSQVKYASTTPVSEPPTRVPPAAETRNKNLPGFKTILMENDKITLPRFQMFAWTWISIIVYLVLVYSKVATGLGNVENLSLPDLNILFVTLMGLSQGAYVTNKLATSTVFSINGIIPSRLKLQPKNNSLTVLGSNFGNQGSVWIERYRLPSEDMVIKRLGYVYPKASEDQYRRYSEQFKEEYYYEPQDLEEQFQATTLKREDNRIVVDLDNIRGELKAQEYIIRVEKDGLLTHLNSDAKFQIIELAAYIRLVLSRFEITENETLDIRAYVTKKNGDYAGDVPIVFFVSDERVARFRNDVNRSTTDQNGRTREVITIEGVAKGTVTIIASASVDGEIAEQSHDIKVKS